LSREENLVLLLTGCSAAGLDDVLIQCGNLSGAGEGHLSGEGANQERREVKGEEGDKRRGWKMKDNVC